MASHDELKRLIDGLPDAEGRELVDFAKALRQKAARSAVTAGLAALDAAPPDDEPDPDEERVESREAWEGFQRDGGVRLEDVRAELGI